MPSTKTAAQSSSLMFSKEIRRRKPLISNSTVAAKGLCIPTKLQNTKSIPVARPRRFTRMAVSAIAIAKLREQHTVNGSVLSRGKDGDCLVRDNLMVAFFGKRPFAEMVEGAAYCVNKY